MTFDAHNPNQPTQNIKYEPKKPNFHEKTKLYASLFILRTRSGGM